MSSENRERWKTLGTLFESHMEYLNSLTDEEYREFKRKRAERYEKNNPKRD